MGSGIKAAKIATASKRKSGDDLVWLDNKLSVHESRNKKPKHSPTVAPSSPLINNDNDAATPYLSLYGNVEASLRTEHSGLLSQVPSYGEVELDRSTNPTSSTWSGTHDLVVLRANKEDLFSQFLRSIFPESELPANLSEGETVAMGIGATPSTIDFHTVNGKGTVKHTPKTDVKKLPGTLRLHPPKAKIILCIDRLRLLGECNQVTAFQWS